MSIDFSFFIKYNKNIRSVKQKLSCFLLSKKEKAIDVHLRVLNHFRKFHRKIFIIVDEKRVKHNCSHGNYPKYHLPLKVFDTYFTIRAI